MDIFQKETRNYVRCPFPCRAFSLYMSRMRPQIQSWILMNYWIPEKRLLTLRWTLGRKIWEEGKKFYNQLQRSLAKKRKIKGILLKGEQYLLLKYSIFIVERSSLSFDFSLAPSYRSFERSTYPGPSVLFVLAWWLQFWEAGLLQKVGS